MKKKLVISKKFASVGLNDFDYGKFRKLDEECAASTMSEIPKQEYLPVPYFQLFKYATVFDKISVLLGTVLAITTGVCLTLINLTFGNITGTIVRYVTTISNTTNTDVIKHAQDFLMDGIIEFTIFSCALGTVSLIFNYASTVLFNYSALQQTFRIRNLFFLRVLEQDIAWYDVQQTGDFSSRIADDLKKIEDGIGEKVSIFVFYMAVCVSCIVQALIVGWELALICMISFPVSAVAMGFVAWISTKLAKQEIEAYGGAGAISEEILSSIRTVIAFDGQQKEEERYNDLLLYARDNNIKRSLYNSISNGIMWFFTYASFALAFWYGVKLILRERHLDYADMTYDPGTMITVFFSVLTGMWYFGMGSPYIEIFGVARGSASKIFSVIASEPVINASKGNGLKPNKLKGNITFEGVHFNYPSRPDVKILRGLTLTIKSGETVALVGSSGCGKSTCIQLIQRYYDPLEGKIYLDDNKLTELDLSWLRERIGVVGQEPVLFETTIAENIKFGHPTARQDDIEKAAKKANAHGFIKMLPQGYDTMVGERGAQLSGGQKQRIAIARALVREPAILLLDEATSALDTNSEAIVQAALDQASNECTTVIVAHRLSTVRKADRIIVISDGNVVEQGTHDELISKKGAYFNLVTAQMSPDETSLTAAPEEEASLIDDEKLEAMERKLSARLSIGSDQMNFENDENKSSYSSLWVVMKFNSPEWWLITIGCLGSVITGAMMPIYSIIFGDLLGVLSNEDGDYVRDQTNLFCVYFLIIGIACGIATFFQMYTFGIAGEKLTMRLRSRMFKAMLSQELAWFDDKDNGVGSLCARLSSEAASVQGATGQRIGSVLNAISTIIIAVATCLYFEWRISLVALCFTPPIVFSIFMEQKLMTKESQGQHSSLLKSTRLAVEAIGNIRTVASLGCEKVFHERYVAELIPYQRTAKRNTHFRGVVYGFSRSLFFFSYAAALYYGVMLIKNENLNYAVVFIVAESLITSSWSIANALAFTPNFQKGLIAANRIFQLLNRTSQIQSGSDNVNERWDKGDINYNRVRFTYPTRPGTEVLKGLDLSILQGKMVALVGPSGCGKSTIVQLLERFYDPCHGSISSDEKNIKRMHLSALRSHLGIVSQEPNLFSKTLAENIAYGDNSRIVSMDEIIAAAKSANIHNFIVSLPLGYNTKLGDKGTQLSGGQKQRVAIARALIRNPKVLLLDEATSALDAESEKIVQEALDNAMKGRTCISIAHRLTTIQDADVICVINQGKLVEIGTHSSLLNTRGMYYDLHRLQKGFD